MSAQKTVAIIGGGPAGLMAAEVLTNEGIRVDLYEAKPSVGRKFLIAGKGGLNLTHSEPLDPFLARYGTQRPNIEPLLAAFGPEQLKTWSRALGIETFVGSSGRVFPEGMKAAPLLRRWVQRLRAAGVYFHVRHRWQGWAETGALLFSTPDGPKTINPTATVLALGGASWPQLGSDGEWVPWLRERSIHVADFLPSNCGFDVGETARTAGIRNGWSDHFQNKFAGAPLKSVKIAFANSHGVRFQKRGACVVTETGIEGSLIYATSVPIRDGIAQCGKAVIHFDLAPDRGQDALAAKLAQSRNARSLSTHLQRKANLKGVQIGLLHELAPDAFSDPTTLAQAIKHLPLNLIAPRPLQEAISSAGGICFEQLDEWLMVKKDAGLFCAGEMLDWEAPTGGYLLTACFASGYVAGNGALNYI